MDIDRKTDLSKSLLSNPVVTEAIKEMRDNLTTLEDKALLNHNMSESERMEKVRHYAYLRLALSELTGHLEHYINSQGD